MKYTDVAALAGAAFEEISSIGFVPELTGDAVAEEAVPTGLDSLYFLLNNSPGR